MTRCAVRTQKVGQRFMNCFLSQVSQAVMRVPSARRTTLSGTRSRRLAISLSSFTGITS